MNQYPNNALLTIEGVNSREAARYYLGKTVLYVYRVKKVCFLELINTCLHSEQTKDAKTGEKHSLRIIRGKISRPHGNNGTVRARFRHNLPPTAFGGPARVMLYPQRS